MEWFAKDDTDKPNVKKANNAWLVTRKRLFPDGFPASAAPEGGAAKVKAPATPRKKKDADAPKTPRAKKSLAKKSEEKGGSGGEESAAEPSTTISGVPDENATAAPVKKPDAETDDIDEARVKEADETATTKKEDADADGDTPMTNSTTEKPIENAPITPVTGGSVADDMSAGSMSPTPATKTKSKPAPTTPKPKAAPKVQKTPDTGNAANAPDAPLPETPITPASKASPKKRKTKAEKEAEAGAAAVNSEGGVDDGAEDKPPTKKRKSVSGKAVVESEGEEAADTDSDGGNSSTKPTPVKTPRKPSAAVLAKRAEKEKEKAEKKAEKEREKAEKEKEKADKKAEKEREKAEKKGSAKKPATKAAPTTTSTTDGEGEPSKPKTPRKPTAISQAKKAEAEKAQKEADDREEAARIAMAAQEEIDKKANDVFNGARIDKPAKDDDSNEHADGDEEIPLIKHDPPETNGFIAINGSGKGDRAASVAAVSGTVKATLEATTEEDGETIAVSEEKTNTVEVQADDENEDTIVVGGGEA